MIGIKEILTKILQWIITPLIDADATGTLGFDVKNSLARVRLGVGNGNSNHGVWSSTLGRWLVHGDASNVYVGGVNVSTLTTAYVIAEGNSGNWHYRKYSNNRWEAWYNVSTTITLNTALANASGWYRNGSAYTLTAPSAIGGTLTVQHADVHPVSGLASTMAVVTAISNATVSYYVISPAASASSISSRATVITAYLQGTWA